MHVIDQAWCRRLGIVEAAVPLIKSSWEAEPPSWFGRFGLAYDGSTPPKLLEYNADTPTSLVEAQLRNGIGWRIRIATATSSMPFTNASSCCRENWHQNFRGTTSTCARWTMLKIDTDGQIFARSCATSWPLGFQVADRRDRLGWDGVSGA